MKPFARRLAALGVAAALLAGTAASSRAAAWEAIEQIPGHAPLTVQVGDAGRIYFRVSAAAPLVVPVAGPARLRVISRIELPAHNNQVVRYTLTVSDGSHELERENTESSASSQVHHPDAAWSLGKSRKMTVDVPNGVQRVTLSTSGSNVLVRLQLSAPASGEQATVALTPVAASRSVLVSEGEKTIPYYTTLAGNPVRFRVVGPTTLDLLTRLDFDETMRGTQAYRLSVAEKGKSLREVNFKTTKATGATYTNLKDRVPSKFDHFQVVISPGLHELSVNLVSPAKGAVEVHARIPQPQTGTEE